MKKKAKNKFEKIRRINDLTQTEESKIIGVSPHHISEFENAIKDNKQNMPISLSLIVKISTLYNVPIDYFFSDESRRFKIQCLYSYKSKTQPPGILKLRRIFFRVRESTMF